MARYILVERDKQDHLRLVMDTSSVRVKLFLQQSVKGKPLFIRCVMHMMSHACAYNYGIYYPYMHDIANLHDSPSANYDRYFMAPRTWNLADYRDPK